MQLVLEILSSNWDVVLVSQLKLWLTVFAFDTLRYLIAAGATCAILYGLLGAWSEGRRTQTRRGSAADIKREIAYSLSTTAIYASVALFSIAALERGYLQHYSVVSDYGWGYTLASFPLVLILHDAYFYWVHRAMHHRKLFRVMHRIHHLSRSPTPWAAYSFAPGEAFVMALFMPLAMALIPLHEVVIFVFLAFMIIRNAMGHSGVEFHHHTWTDGPLDALTTVTHHDMHHQNFKGNFGLYFTWWDRWMGTELPHYKSTFKISLQRNGCDDQKNNAGNAPANTIATEA